VGRGSRQTAASSTNGSPTKAVARVRRTRPHSCGGITLRPIQGRRGQPVLRKAHSVKSNISRPRRGAGIPQWGSTTPPPRTHIASDYNALSIRTRGNASQNPRSAGPALVVELWLFHCRA
jgi:hypothetical protein